MREHDDRDLRALLRDEAERHHPDRDAMLSRIVTARTEARRPAALIRLRPLAAAGGVAVVLVASIAGARLLGGGDSAPDDQVAASTTASAPVSPSPSLSPSRSASASRSPSKAPSSASSSRPGTTGTTGSGETTGTGETTGGGEATGGTGAPRASTSSGAAERPKATSGYLSSKAVLDPGSNVGWSQGDVLLTTTEKITELEVTVTVVKTDGVAEPGQWSSIPEAMMTNTVTERDGNLVYSFVLKQGNVLDPREYTFAVQYHHAASGRSMSADTYQAKAVSSGAVRVTVEGGF